ncbi:MAG: hypothetical protein K0R71_735 [Bacillales bacterium]|nr:hypothetical protein [Bacillales bacterium]
MKRLDFDYFKQDVLDVAPDLIGKMLVRKMENGKILRHRIMETEAYRGEIDTACHARAGKTKRTKPLYKQGGITYIYLCYGIHHLLNVVTGAAEEPQAVLIRAVEGFNGPGKLTKALKIDITLNEVDLFHSDVLWIEDDGYKPHYIATKRIGIDYATEFYRNIEWRFVQKDM